MGYQGVRDASLSLSLALSAGNATTQSATGLDVAYNSGFGQYSPSGDGDFLAEIPALTTVQLPDNAQIIVNVIASNSPNMASPVVVGTVATLVGSGGAGTPAVNSRFRPASGCLRYLGLQCIGSGSPAAGGAIALLTFTN